MKAKNCSCCTGIILVLIFLFCATGTQTPLFASPNGWHLLNVTMQDRNSGWATANSQSGISILYTRDSGKTWNNVSPKKFWPQSARQLRYNYNSSYQNIASFCTAKECWVCFIHTVTLSIDKSLISPNLLSAASAGLDAGKIELLHTENSGGHWISNTFAVPRALGGGAIYLSFVDHRTGYLLATSSPAAGKAYSWLYRTGDSGLTWSKVYDNYPKFARADDAAKPRKHLDFVQDSQKIRGIVGSTPTGIAFKDRLSGWAGSFPGRSALVPLFHTVDGGVTWTIQPLLVPDGHNNGTLSIFSPEFFGDKRLSGILPTYCADAKSEGCIFYSTSDGGKSWKAGQFINLHTEVSRLAYSFVSKNDGFAIDGTSRFICKTVDGGINWTETKTEPPLGNSVFSLNSNHQLDFVDANNGWCLYDVYDEKTHLLSNVLVMTQNAGKNWRRMYTSVQTSKGRGLFY